MNLLGWFRVYLASCSQFVCINNHTSTLLPVTSGFPQKGILGSLLFVIYYLSFTNFAKLHCLRMLPSLFVLFLVILAVTICNRTSTHCVNVSSLLTTSHSMKANTSHPHLPSSMLAVSSAINIGC